MYTLKTIDEILGEDPCPYGQYSLCYIDDISETIYDYTPESRAIIESPGFSWAEEKRIFGSPSCRLETGEIPNPDYVSGEKELLAYFTQAPLSDTWGDDWNDAPYEHNAGCPYDTIGSGYTRKDIEILEVPFAIPGNLDTKRPSDWCWSGNSSFCVEDINDGVIPWLYVRSSGKSWKSVKIFAGINPYKFIYELSVINKL